MAFKTVQLKEQDLEKIEQLARKLEQELGIQMSNAKAIMYAINKLEG